MAAKPKFAVVAFPGSNCDHDCFWVLDQIFQVPVKMVWHKEKELGDVDCIVLPGGFSYGDYLRTGAVARFSPVMEAVAQAAREGKKILGICNGFQILLESGLLPGGMLRNASLKFVCKQTYLKVENNQTPFTHLCQKGDVLEIPVAHGEGNYYADKEVLARLNKNNQIVFRYCDAEGNITPEANPNGSLENIAGICNEAGNVLGMMPHPERACDPLLGSSDGKVMFESILKAGLQQLAVNK